MLYRIKELLAAIPATAYPIAAAIAIALDLYFSSRP